MMIQLIVDLIQNIFEMGSCLGDPKNRNNLKSTQLQIGQYNICLQEKITNGAYGDIWKCKNIETRQLYAGKQIKLQNQQLKDMYQKQVKWLKKCNDMNGIIKYIASQQIKMKDHRVSGIILTQFCETTLFEQIRNNKMKVNEILNIVKQVLKTLRQLHSKKCIHLDLKPQNILFSCKGQNNYKLCDMGSCLQLPIDVKSMKKADKSKLKQYFQANSTMIYRSPEMIDVQSMTKIISGKSDIWMMGCIVYLMLYRKHPFEGEGQLAIMTGCANYPQFQYQSQQEKSKGEKVVELIKKMLVVNQEQRQDQQSLLSFIDSI